MPLYVYHCPACGKEMEVLRPSEQRDAPLRCESCGGTEAQRSSASYASAVQGSSRGFAGGVSSGGSCGGGGGFT
jgi:putative FmdB family regulatory protein